MSEMKYIQARREQLKATASPELLAYIETLETIADLSFDVWWSFGDTTGHDGKYRNAEQEQCADALYDALAAVDFLHQDVQVKGE